MAILPLAADEKAKTDLGLSGRLPNIISESGIYKLVMRSDKPEARKLQDWVTRDVLPAIRKDGMYVAARFGKRHDHVLRDIGTLLPKIGGGNRSPPKSTTNPAYWTPTWPTDWGMLTPA